MGGSKLFIDSDDGSRIFGEICDRQQSQEKAKEEAAECGWRADKSYWEAAIDAVNVAEMMECSTCQDLDPR